MSETVIEAKNLTKIYHSGNITVRAVDCITLSVRAGEFIGLVGPSGSGKTTLLAMLAALLAPNEGQVLIDENDLGKMNEKERGRFRRQKIGFTFQSNNLVPYLTVLENVELMLRLNNRLDKSGRQMAREMLVSLGLEERLNNLPSQLSGGQRQRVTIARSLIHSPSVVLADEPTASLDTERAYQVTQIYADLIHEQKKAGIMVTHDLRMCKYVDRIIQMKDGKMTAMIDDRDAIEALITCG